MGGITVFEIDRQSPTQIPQRVDGPGLQRLCLLPVAQHAASVEGKEKQGSRGGVGGRCFSCFYCAASSASAAIPDVTAGWSLLT